MSITLDSELQTRQRYHSPAGGKMVKTAAEACLADLKARDSEHFLSEKVIQVISGFADLNPNMT
jgi:hypothetical protein